MKATLLATAAVAVFAAAPAMAQDAIGSIGLGYVHTDYDGFKDDGAAINGSVATSAFGDWTVTFDGSLSYSDENDYLGDTTSALGAHVSRIVNDIRIGGFVSVQNNEILDMASVGAEAQKTFQQATLTGSVSYSDAAGAEAWNVGVDGAYYPMDNLRLNATVGFGDFDAPGAHIDAWTYIAGAEYQFASTPYSVFANYELTEIEDINLDIETFKIGFRYNFGGSLQAQDRSGANIGRATLAPIGVLGF